MTDPILYPMPSNTVTGLRQDVARRRAELGDTVAALAERVDPRRQAEDGIRTALRSPIVIGGTVVAGVAAVIFAVPHRGFRHGAAVTIVGALIGAAAITASRGRSTASEVGSAEPPQTPDEPDAAPRVELPPSPPGGDVVDVLLEQHRQVETAFARVANAGPADKLDTFATLVSLLNSHEKGEQEVVHPVLRELSPDATAIVDARIAEETRAERSLANVIAMGVTDERFDRALAELADSVHAHAQREETEEFPLIRRDVPVERRQRMANGLNAVRADLL